MRSCFSHLASVLLLSAAYSPSLSAASLPLRDGNYTSGVCKNRSEITESIGLYTLTSGPKRGQRFLTPDAEGAFGSCYLSTIHVAANRFSGIAKCSLSERTEIARVPYRFIFEIINSSSFISRGKFYKWCLEHR